MIVSKLEILVWETVLPAGWKACEGLTTDMFERDPAYSPKVHKSFIDTLSPA